MINGVVLGVAIFASSSGATPTQEAAAADTRTPVFTFELPEAAGPQAEPRHVSALPRRQTPTAKRHSTVDRIIAVAAGASIGFVVGGTIGAYAADNRDNPDDDISALRGVIIGAPIGAVVGAVLGYRLTK